MSQSYKLYFLNKNTIVFDRYSTESLLLIYLFPCVLLSLISLIILFFLATPLFAFVFGNEWQLAGQLTAILIFGQTLKFIVSPLSSTLIALQDVRYSAIWQVLYFVAMIWLFIQPGASIEDFTIRYCLIDLVAYSLYFGLIFLRIQHYEKLRS